MKFLFPITLAGITFLLVSSSVATTVATAPHDEEPAPAVVKWEYRTEAVNYNVSGPPTDLNKIGAEGWELVQIVDGIGVFKRVKTGGGEESRSSVQIEVIEDLEVIVLRGKEKDVREAIGLMRGTEKGRRDSAASVKDNAVQTEHDQPGGAAHKGKKRETIGDGFAPRLVYLRHTQAAQVAKVLQEVYSDRQRDMSVGQMPRINAVVVVTPYSLFWEIKELVEALDRAATESNEPVLRMSVPQPCADGVEEGMKASELEHRKRLLRGIELQQTPPPRKKGG